MYTETERRYLDTTNLGRLASVTPDGFPHVVPVCFAHLDDQLVTPIDEKPQRIPATALQRVKNIQNNPQVVLLADHYTDNWADLGWLQIHGQATITIPNEPPHAEAITELRVKYTQYESHALEDRPIITITPERTRSWGTLTHD